MGLPAIVGIPWLAGILGALFASIFAFFAKFVTHRLALVLLVGVTIATLTAAFVAALAALLSTVAVITPDVVHTGLGIVAPSNFYACISVILTAHLLRWAYEWNVKIVQMKLF